MRCFNGSKSNIAAAVAVLIVAHSACAESAGAARPLRDWQPEDSIALTYYASNQESPLAWRPVDQDAIVYSPDHRRFFFLSHRGMLACDCNEMTLSVFSVDQLRDQLNMSADVRRKPIPSSTITFDSAWSSDFMAGISEAHWIDNATIELMGVRGSGPKQVYDLDVRSSRLKQLTHAPSIAGGLSYPTGVVQATRAGANLLYEQAIAVRNVTRVNNYPEESVTTGDLNDLYEDGSEEWTNGIFGLSGGHEHLIARNRAAGIGANFWVAPDNRWAIVSGSFEDFPSPDSWRDYDGPLELPRLTRFLLVDLHTMSAKPVFDAPTGAAIKSSSQSGFAVLWTHDDHVVLINSALPLGGGSKTQTTGYVVDLDANNGKWTTVAAIRPPASHKFFNVSAHWIDENSFELNYIDPLTAEEITHSTYRRVANEWTEQANAQPAMRKAPEASKSEELSVTIRQDANTPPVVVASNGTSEVRLTDPDSALKGIWRAESRPVDWIEPSGDKVAGQLYLPRDYDASRPPPVVIQAYYQLPQYFRPDGAFPTAYAAQSLAARGFAVLLLDITAVDEDIADTRSEGPRFVQRVDAAVTTLARRQLVDQSRVGLIGFSRAGYEVSYAVTHPGAVRLGASIVADSIQFNFEDYLFELGRSFHSDFNGIIGSYDKVYGGSLWEAKDAWFADAPSFNMDKVRTPMLFEYMGRSQWPNAFTIFGKYRPYKIPVEYLMFPRGSHQLIRPRERVASIRATVDWMSFWLQPDRQKTLSEDRRRKWQRMKDDWVTEQRMQRQVQKSTN